MQGVNVKSRRDKRKGTMTLFETLHFFPGERFTFLVEIQIIKPGKAELIICNFY